MMAKILAQLEQDKEKSEPRQSPVIQEGNNAPFKPNNRVSYF